MTSRSPILATAHHDPKGKYNDLFLKSLPDLQRIFSKLCISVSPPTAKDNGRFMQQLKKSGCEIFINKKDSNPGDHFRHALRLAAENAKIGQTIFYGDVDRVLFQLASRHRRAFIKDLSAPFKDFLVFERTEKVWRAYPKAYREMERHVAEMGSLIYGSLIEYNYCAALFSKKLAERLFKNSLEDHYNARGEWILIYFKLHGHFPASKKVSWLAWEDPFWEGKTSELLKSERERDLNETMARIDSNSRFIRLFSDQRFRPSGNPYSN